MCRSIAGREMLVIRRQLVRRRRGPNGRPLPTVAERLHSLSQKNLKWSAAARHRNENDQDVAHRGRGGPCDRWRGSVRSSIPPAFHHNIGGGSAYQKRRAELVARHGDNSVGNATVACYIR